MCLINIINSQVLLDEMKHFGGDKIGEYFFFGPAKKLYNIRCTKRNLCIKVSEQQVENSQNVNVRKHIKCAMFKESTKMDSFM